jgi:hypothetical protein
MNIDRDQARLIAERVARRVSESSGTVSAPADPVSGRPAKDRDPNIRVQNSSNGAPVREEISAIRAGLHDLESKLERIESKLVQTSPQTGEAPRARVINFLSSGPPVPVSPSIGISPRSSSSPPEVSEPRDFVPATRSPWLASMASMSAPPSDQSNETNQRSATSNQQSPAHPSQERFGVDEAVVSELVEFFENEKKCSIDPSGKPCDHCAMCSGRGF